MDPHLFLSTFHQLLGILASASLMGFAVIVPVNDGIPMGYLLVKMDRHLFLPTFHQLLGVLANASMTGFAVIVPVNDGIHVRTPRSLVVRWLAVAAQLVSLRD
jgi:hypothetical protein